MTTAILCTVAFILVLWVILLKLEVEHLKKNNRRMKASLDEKLRQATGGITVEKGRRLTASEIKHIERGAKSADRTSKNQR